MIQSIKHTNTYYANTTIYIYTRQKRNAYSTICKTVTNQELSIKYSFLSEISCTTSGSPSSNNRLCVPSGTSTSDSANRSVRCHFAIADAFSRNSVPRVKHVQSQLLEGECEEGEAKKKTTTKKEKKKKKEK